jgi:hypothetical protein
MRCRVLTEYRQYDHGLVFIEPEFERGAWVDFLQDYLIAECERSRRMMISQ